MMPEILSRLSSKASLDKKKEILEFMKRFYLLRDKIFSLEYGDIFSSFDEILNRIIASIHPTEQKEVVSILLDFPIMFGHFSSHPAPNPILSFMRNQIDDINLSSLLVPKCKIENLLSEMAAEVPDINPDQDGFWHTSTKRDWCFGTLAFLHAHKKLDSDEQKRFGQLIWAHTDSVNKLPIINKKLKMYFCVLPHPDDVNPVSLVKQYIKSSPFPIQPDKTGKTPSFDALDGVLCQEIISFTSIMKKHYSESERPDLMWTNEELTDLINRLLDWWDADNKFLKLDDEDRFSGFHSIRGRFTLLVNVLTALILYKPDIILDEATNNRLKICIDNMNETNIHITRLMAACLALLPEIKDQLSSRIISDLSTKERNRLIDIVETINNIQISNLENDFANLFEAIGYNLLYRGNDFKDVILGLCSNIVHKYIKNPGIQFIE